eukprot:9485329-Pyramimonas_sp.AAC.1
MGKGLEDTPIPCPAAWWNIHRQYNAGPLRFSRVGALRRDLGGERRLCTNTVLNAGALGCGSHGCRGGASIMLYTSA